MVRRISAYAILMGFVSLCAFAAPPQAAAPTPEVGRAVAFGVSPAVRDLPARVRDTVGPKRDPDGPLNPPLPRLRGGMEGPLTPEAARDMGLAPEGGMPGPIVQWDGPSNSDNAAEYGFRLSPPDTNHDVGPNHVVMTTNLLVRIYDKTGTPDGPPFRMSDLFSTIGGTCANNDDGDPIVLYDQLADRWLISQFAFPAFPNPPYHQCVAISTTGDPTGTYFAYDFLVPNNELNDYPHFGVWPDAYYMTVNQFTNAGPFNGTGAYAFDREKMLAGDPAPTFIYFNLNLASFPEGIGGTLPADADGAMPPPAGAPGIVAYFIATEFGDASDGIRFFDFHVDFDTPASSTFTERAGSPLAVAAFNPLSPAGRADIEQPPPALASHSLDSISDRFMHRLQYRNFGTHESFVTNHTVNVGTGTTQATHQAGVRYYELRRTGAPANPITVHEQATFAPDTHNRWMGSVALDNDGNLAAGYSVSSTTVFPSIRYAGRLAGDPPGGLAQGEATMIAGSGVQQSTASRWGDYSMMAVDPADDCTFWYSQEYYTAASQATSTVGWLTRVGSFKFPTCTAPATGSVEVNVVNCDTNGDVAGASVSMGGFFRVTDATGQALIGGVAAGDYTVNVSLPGYLGASGPVTVVAGNTTVINVCLTPIAIVEEDAGTVTAESCAPANSVPDPGENVTVSLCVINNGAAPTVNLVGTLQAGGGVMNPSGPQNYGAVPGAGGVICRDFTFDVSALCGDVLSASVVFQDGSNSYGTFVYDFRVGVFTTTPSLAQNFDAVVPPALPAGWTTTNAGTGVAWATTATTPDSAPNAAFTTQATNTGEASLVSPTIAITSDSALVTFRHSYVTENNFDGGVLEIKIGAGAFQDIVAAGGSFVTGGYDDALTAFSGCAGNPNPLATRLAWNGNSGGYRTTTANLPASAEGENVQLRWRSGTDCSVAPAGANWRVDTITLLDGYVCCSVPLVIVPTSLKVDQRAAAGTTGNLDGVWVPGERVLVETGWTMIGPSPYDITGAASNLIGPAGATYTLNDAAADFGTVPIGGETDCGSDCYQVSVDNPMVRPASPWAATVNESLNPVPSMPTGGGFNKTWSLHIGNSFLDAQAGSFAFRFIETLFKNGVTSGCGGGNYCPNSNVLREQMAVFLLVALEGVGYTPPACVTPVFGDVPCSSVYSRWVNELANPARAITSGCGGGNYCPADPVTREQMAVFLLRTEGGASYVPPACTVPQFDDVPCTSGYAPWINELANRGITSGCSVTPALFCPTTPVTRAQMSVFLTVTFGLVLYGP